MLGIFIFLLGVLPAISFLKRILPLGLQRVDLPRLAFRAQLHFAFLDCFQVTAPLSLVLCPPVRSDYYKPRWPLNYLLFLLLDLRLMYFYVSGWLASVVVP